MLLSSFFWHLTRWGGLFCCSYVVTKATGNPLLVQLDGALIFVPMLFGFAAGAMTDHFNRCRGAGRACAVAALAT
jgi:hypothetical protein